MPTIIHRPPELGGNSTVDDGKTGGPLAIGLGDNIVSPARNTYVTLIPRGAPGKYLPGHTVHPDNGREPFEISPEHPSVQTSQTVFEYKG